MKIERLIVAGTPFVVLEEEGLKATLCAQGASICHLEYGGKTLVKAEKNLEDYLKSGSYYGRTVGRFAGRIENGLLDYEGIHLEVPPNEGQNALHGGPHNFAFREFAVKLLEDGVLFHLDSKDGDNGFPGNLGLDVIYKIEKGKLHIVYEYESDKKTLVNLTNHAFYNAGGDLDVLDQRLEIKASRVMSYRKDLIPLGFVALDEATDFNTAKPIGQNILAPELYETNTQGYDHCYYRGDHDYDEPLATLKGERLTIKLYSDAPAIQIYTDNFLLNSPIETTVWPEKLHGSVALEPVYPPLDYATMVVEPNRRYSRRITIEVEENR